MSEAPDLYKVFAQKFLLGRLEKAAVKNEEFCVVSKEKKKKENKRKGEGHLQKKPWVNFIFMCFLSWKK